MSQDRRYRLFQLVLALPLVGLCCLAVFGAALVVKLSMDAQRITLQSHSDQLDFYHSALLHLTARIKRLEQVADLAPKHTDSEGASQPGHTPPEPPSAPKEAPQDGAPTPPEPSPRPVPGLPDSSGGPNAAGRMGHSGASP